jgi:hypothetical protein
MEWNEQHNLWLPWGTPTNGFPTRYHGTWARDVQNHTACFLNAIHLKNTVWCPPSPKKGDQQFIHDLYIF